MRAHTMFTIAPTLALVILGGCTPADEHATILDPAGTHYGHTYAEWGAEWWRWIIEIPASVSPALDETGAHCDEHQTRDVFFLAGTFGTGSVVRTECVVPAGKPLFIPLLNAEADDCAVDEGRTAEELRGAAAESVDAGMELSLEVDGVSLGSELASFEATRSAPVMFEYTSPEADSLFEYFGQPFSGRCAEAASDGYGVLLAPLPAGPHEIHFRAAGSDSAGPFVIEATYQLVVE